MSAVRSIGKASAAAWEGDALHRTRGFLSASGEIRSMYLSGVIVAGFLALWNVVGWALRAARLSTYNYCRYLPTGTIVPTIHHSTLPSSAIHFPQKNAPEGMEANVEEGSRASHGNFSCLERANAVADGTNRIGSRDSDQWRSDCM